MNFKWHFRNAPVLVSSIIFAMHSFAFGVFEPSIECTVIKVHLTRKVFGFESFPKLYQSINNDPTSSKLMIGGKEFSKINPLSTIKTENYEKIVIDSGADQLGLELKGKPVSRNGTMTVNGATVADVTCH